MDFTMFGPGIVLGLGCIGSAIGCGIAGMASHGVMTHVEEGHGKFIGLSAMPSSQSIYGFVLMIRMKAAIVGGGLSSMSAVGIALFAGLAIMVSAIYQGKAVATAIQASAKQPAIFGKCATAAGIIESFAIFAFVFALLLL
ncbi:MAG: V-type sodium ATPase subunit K [Candidatus Anoxychlamydiales bacterium]|nr:V-type sodium ATPase subunit K [Candidatus Anoxychlamydiales bacterium]